MLLATSTYMRGLKCQYYRSIPVNYDVVPSSQTCNCCLDTNYSLLDLTIGHLNPCKLQIPSLATRSLCKRTWSQLAAHLSQNRIEGKEIMVLIRNVSTRFFTSPTCAAVNSQSTLCALNSAWQSNVTPANVASPPARGTYTPLAPHAIYRN